MYPIITPENDLVERFKTYMSNANYRTPQAHWIKCAFDNKKRIAERLGLPSPCSGFLIPFSTDELPTETECNLVGMITYAEGTNYRFLLHQVNFDRVTLTYKFNGKERKLIRRLRQAPVDRQVAALYYLCHILNIPALSIKKNEDGSVPWDSLWSKLGDELNSALSMLITPDPVMLLGSGIFKNTNSCHRPGGEYEKGPFTYAYDDASFAMFLYRKGVEPDFEPNLERSNNNPQMALGRTLYFLNPDEEPVHYIQGRPYGISSDVAMRAARDVIGEQLRTSHNPPIPPTKWKVQENDSVSLEVPRFTYADENYFTGRYIVAGFACNENESESENALVFRPSESENALVFNLSEPCAPEETVTLSAGGYHVPYSSSISTIELEEPDCPVCGSYGMEDCRCIGEKEYSCECCGDGLDEDEIHCEEGSDYIYCRSCFEDRFSYCERCNTDRPNDGMRDVIADNRHPRGYQQTECWCENCCDDHAVVCDGCEELVSEAVYSHHGASGDDLCPDCYADRIAEEEEEEERAREEENENESPDEDALNVTYGGRAYSVAALNGGRYQSHEPVTDIEISRENETSPEVSEPLAVNGDN